MARKVEWAGSAWIDLAEIAEYLERDSPSYAGAFVREVREASRSLRSFSERGRIVPELQDPNLRELILGSYRLLYRVYENEVRIIGIVHGARDFNRYRGDRPGKD